MAPQLKFPGSKDTGVQNATSKLKAHERQHMRTNRDLSSNMKMWHLSVFLLKPDQERSRKSLNITRAKTIRTLGSKKQLQITFSSLGRRLMYRIDKDKVRRIRCLQFSFSTGGAREEQRELTHTQ